MASTGHFVLTNDKHGNLPTFSYCIKNIAYLRAVLGAALIRNISWHHKN